MDIEWGFWVWHRMALSKELTDTPNATFLELSPVSLVWPIPEVNRWPWARVNERTGGRGAAGVVDRINDLSQ